MNLTSKPLKAQQLEGLLQKLRTVYPQPGGISPDITCVGGLEGVESLPRPIRFQTAVIDYFHCVAVKTDTGGESAFDTFRRVFRSMPESVKEHGTLCATFRLETKSYTKSEREADVAKVGWKKGRGHLSYSLRGISNREAEKRVPWFKEYFGLFDLPVTIKETPEGYYLEAPPEWELESNGSPEPARNPTTFDCQVSPDMNLMERYVQILEQQISSGKFFAKGWTMSVRGLVPAIMRQTIHDFSLMDLPSGPMDYGMIFNLTAAGQLEDFRQFGTLDQGFYLKFPDFQVGGDFVGLSARLNPQGCVVTIDGEQEAAVNELFDCLPKS